jgi:CRISPR type I-E-associated protein CasB/Cse2
MNNTPENPKESRASRLLAQLGTLSSNRGAMAILRRSASDARPFQAFPIFGKLGIIHDEAAQTVAMLYAMHPSHKAEQWSNIGSSLAKLRADVDDKGVASFDKRFHRILSCKSLEELSEFLLRLWPLLAKDSIPIPVNYEQLYWDLCPWAENAKNYDPEKIRMRWAKSYFGATQTTEEVAP